jgi:hypothetical protein
MICSSWSERFLFFSFHQEPRQFLQRLRSLTEAFQIGEGIIYQGVCLFDRRVNPEQRRIRRLL